MSTSEGEKKLQQQFGSQDRATRFYDRQMHVRLTSHMQSFICRQEMVFIATADGRGNCDCSPRFGKMGFVVVLDEKTLAFPEFRGNGVFASLGNILENPHIGLVFIDFFDTTVGLHVNGKARICEAEKVPDSLSFEEKTYKVENSSRLIERWVIVQVDEAYIHCSKHVPRLQKLEKPITWGTDDPQAKEENFFVREPSSLESGESNVKRKSR